MLLTDDEVNEKYDEKFMDVGREIEDISSLNTVEYEENFQLMISQVHLNCTAYTPHKDP